jgi:hypothetical protein
MSMSRDPEKLQSGYEFFYTNSDQKAKEREEQQARLEMRRRALNIIESCAKSSTQADNPKTPSDNIYKICELIHTKWRQKTFFKNGMPENFSAAYSSLEVIQNAAPANPALSVCYELATQIHHFIIDERYSIKLSTSTMKLWIKNWELKSITHEVCTQFNKKFPLEVEEINTPEDNKNPRAKL